MSAYQPLSAKVRPQILDDYIGQEHLLAQGKPLRLAYEQGKLHSMIFWGPPGTGKTTLARMLASRAQADFVSLSAVTSGVKEIRQVVEAAKGKAQPTVLFMDEVHRFNKAQQDAFLPHVEEGILIFIGATTENPSFELNSALLSRARVYVLKPLTTENIETIISTTLTDELQLTMSDELIQNLASICDGDARRALNLLEMMADFAANTEDKNITEQFFNDVIGDGVSRRFDKYGEEFYDQISAIHKSVRGSDPDAALYWLCRMLEGGCDPLYAARRIVRMATEDIGNADPNALNLAMNAWDVYERLGSPEGELALAQAVVYMAVAPKSNAVYTAYKAAMKSVKENGTLPIPLRLRNAPTRLMKDLDYGKNYRYAHDEPHAYAAGEHYFPDEMPKVQFYKPVDRGLEKKIREKLKFLNELDKAKA